MNLIIASLIVWRVTSFLYRERGLFNIFGRLRNLLGIYQIPKKENDIISYDLESDNELGKMFLCFWCLSVWVSLAYVLIMGEGIELALAHSTGAILIDSYVQRIQF